MTRRAVNEGVARVCWLLVFALVAWLVLIGVVWGLGALAHYVWIWFMTGWDAWGSG